MTLMIGMTYDLRTDYLAEGFTEEQVAEFDFPATIDAIEAAILSLGYAVDRIGNIRALAKRLVSRNRWDIVFNIAEGLHGRCRESQVPALLEAYDIDYVGSDPLVCAATLDKGIAKKIVRAAGIATPAFHVVRNRQDLLKMSLRYPLFAKPLAEGTGKGIDANSRIESFEQLESICRDLLARFHQPVLVEEYLPGREFTTGIVGTGATAKVIGTMEIAVAPAQGDAIYGNFVKEECDTYVDYSTPERDELLTKIESVALESYHALECRDMGRVDIRLDADGVPAFIEVNPLPGLHPTHSDLPMIATRANVSFPELIGSILESALKRTGVYFNGIDETADTRPA